MLTACRTLPSAERTVTLPPDGFLTGQPTAFGPPAACEHDDYVYDAQLSPDAKRLAFTRLGLKTYTLSICSPATAKREADVPVNGYEYDVEALAWAPDGSWLAAASRDGALRLYDTAGALRGAWLSDEKLSAVAVHPDGRSLAVGSDHGVVTLLSLDPTGLRFEDERHLHGDEVRALAFAPDGRLFTAGWDKTVRVLKPSARTVRPDSARVHAERSGGTALLRGVVSGKASVPFALDGRVHATMVLRPALAHSLGIDLDALTETVSLPTALGTTLGRVAHDVSLSFKALTLEHLDAVVCDACVPRGADAALGDGFTARVEVAFDEVTHDAVLKLKPGTSSAERELIQLDEVSKLDFPAYVNDLSIDRAGTKLALALSESKAQRNMEVYQREKRGEAEPEREWDAAVIADAATGKVLAKFHGHHGVVSTAALSPDGATVVSGGWDHKVVLHVKDGDVLELGALVRKVRFSRDGRWLAVAAWTPRKTSAGSPSAFVLPVAYLIAAAAVAQQPH